MAEVAPTTDPKPAKHPGGRPKNPNSLMIRGTKRNGLPGKIARQFAMMCTFANQAFRKRLIRECEDGTIHPIILRELMHYAAGKPAEKVEIDAHSTVLLVLRHQLGYDPLPPREPAQAAKQIGRAKTAPGSESLVPMPPGAEVGR